MKKGNYRWRIIGKSRKSSKSRIGRKNQDYIISVLLANRGIDNISEKDEFFDPKKPLNLTIEELGIDKKEVDKAVKRIKKAIGQKERIIIYGDYDADGICATAILWESLYAVTKRVLPYIPDRFTEGYGINSESIQRVKSDYPDLKLIITVDNGIVAKEAVETARKLGIDVIISDHHTKTNKTPNALAIVHTTKLCGSSVAWVLAREFINKIQISKPKFQIEKSLDLAAIGTISDQMPLIAANRSFAKLGLQQLNITKRPGLLALFKEAGLINDRTRLRSTSARQIGTYEVNYIIAPRINSMGRMEHAIESLRLLCTKDKNKASELAAYLGETNRKRQDTVEEVVIHAKSTAERIDWHGVIVLADESYHEGVIGLVASKLVEEYHRPAIVLSKGREYSKASARSVSGFNIIEAIREVEYLTEGGGGHPMAAGFTIKTKNINKFIEEFDRLSEPLLSDEVLSRKMKIDMELQFYEINDELVSKLDNFEPTGMGNPKPSFITKKVSVLDARTVGRNSDHLKLILQKGEHVYNAIAFSFGPLLIRLTPGALIDIAYNLEFNRWNGRESLQIKLRDIKLT